MAAKLTISQCMIVKNEEENIRRALSWGKGVVSEQIVVDTGSTDRTAEIAEEMGAKVYHFEWCDDFSAAKNFAIRKASGRWITFLDADEYFSEEDARKLPKILKLIETSPYPKGQRPDSVRTSIANLDDDGKVFAMAVHERIFRNKKNIGYTGAVHEVLGDLHGHLLRYHDATRDLTIMHTGYMNSVFKGKMKGERNIRLLKKEVERNPDNFTAWAYLGNSMMVDHRDEEALEVLGELLEKNFERTPELARNMALSNWYTVAARAEPEVSAGLKEKSLLFYEKFRKMGKPYPDADYGLARHLYHIGDLDGAVHYFEQSLKSLDEYKDFNAVEMAGSLTAIYNTLADYYQRKGQASKLVYYLTLSLRSERYQARILVVLLQTLQHDPATSAQQAYDFLGKLYDLSKEKDADFTAQIAAALRYTELEALLKEKLPAKGEQK